MEFINTHSHVYTEKFDVDRDTIIAQAIQKGISKIILPDIDSQERKRLQETCKKYPDVCLPLFGIHPTSIQKNYKQEIEKLEQVVATEFCIGIGEIGIDLYWDKTFINEQIEAFIYQITLADKIQKPVVIHVRNSFNEIFDALAQIKNINFKGLFHCFSGDLKQAYKVLDMGFLLGIGGVVTYKNSGLLDIVKNVGISNIVLETDDPWLAPVPYRGQRNEPRYIIDIAEYISIHTGIPMPEIASVTTTNAKNMFSI